MIACYGTFTVIMKRELTPSIVFSSMAVFDLLRDQLHTIFFMVPYFIQAKVSLDRVTDFLQNVRPDRPPWLNSHLTAWFRLSSSTTTKRSLRAPHPRRSSTRRASIVRSSASKTRPSRGPLTTQNPTAR
jgi:hypothetical protein